VPTTLHAIPKGLVQRLRSQLAVLQNSFPPSQLFKSHRGSETAAQLVACYTSIFADFAAVEAARQAYAAALVQRTSRIAEAMALADSVKAILTNVLGAGHPALDVPGLRQHGGPRKVTSEQKVIKQAKTRKTLELQGRLTKAQKKERTFRGKVIVTVTKKGTGSK
jgi:hypothetical protein